MICYGCLGLRMASHVCPSLRDPAETCNVCPGLRMASPSQTCSPLRLSSLPTAIGRPGYSADDSFIPRTPDLRRAKISASFLLWFAYGEATTPALCCACRRLPPARYETAAGRSLSTMRRPQGFLSGRLSGVGAKEPLWLPTGDQGRLVSAPLWLSEKVAGCVLQSVTEK